MTHRLTIAAASSVILASLSEFALIKGTGWLDAAVGAVLVVALAGTLTRQSPGTAAIGATLLAAVAVVPLVAARSPYLIAAGLVVVGCCAASAWPLRPLRAFGTGVTYLAALLLYVNLIFAARRSLLHVIPTSGSLSHLLTLARAGAGLTAFAPPVPGSRAVEELAAASIGLAAITVDILAVRMRRPAIAGLPLLVVYLAPVATTANITGLAGFVAFALAAAGYLALLSADGRNRLRRWGKLVTVWHSADADDQLGGADVGALAATGRRIGLAAVCAAVIAPLLLPTLRFHRLFAGGGAGGGTQSVAVGLPDPVAQLHTLLSRTVVQRVLTYRTSGSGSYLQIYVLNYNPQHGRWDLVQPTASTNVGTGRLLRPPGLAARTPTASTTLTVTFSPAIHGYTWPIFFLPVPYWPQSLQAPGNWQESDGTLMLYSGGVDPAGMQYTVTSSQAEPTRAQLNASQRIPPAIAGSYLSFRSAVTSQLAALALQITGRYHTAFLKAAALEQWFQSDRFSYSLSSPLPNTPQGLLKFLTTTRRGNCQQFAFAMAVLARLTGIPARVAIGYTAGTRQANGSWLVTTADAHAWPELYFSGIGWLRFEPTPAGAGGQGTAVQPNYVASAPLTGPPATGVGPTTTPTPAASRSHPPINGRVIHGPLGASGTGRGRAQRSGVAAALLILLGLLAAAAAAPGTARAVVRRRRWRLATSDIARAEAAWLEIRADLEDHGLPCLPSDSPRAVARRVRDATEGADGAGPAIDRITAVIERARYAPAPIPAGSSLREDARLVRRALARSGSAVTRWRARLAPASTLRPVRATFRQGMGLLGGWTPGDESLAESSG